MTVQPITPLLRLSNLSDDEDRLLNALLRQLSSHEVSNALKLAYYEGEQRVRQLGIAIPPSLADLEAVVGWPGTTVDVIEERLDWYGWASDSDVFGLDEVYAANTLNVEGGLTHLDALIYGTAFAAVGTGDVGEPSPLVTMHSPRGMTGLWSQRSRRLMAAVSVTREFGVSYATLYLPDQTVRLSRPGDFGNQWQVEDRDVHRLGRVPVVQFENRARTDVVGRSEISKAVRYYTDNAVRTMLGMEVHREFYQAPQRYALNVDQSQFVNPDGTVQTGWEAIMGRLWAIPANPDSEEKVEVGQFSPASPTPYIDQVKGLGQLLAAEAAIPPSYLGFQTDNPASADAIQRSEARLVKRTERRQAWFGRAWLEVGRLALLVRDGVIPEEFASVSAKWRDAATPTRSAAADEATKLVGAGILPPDSQVTYDRIGLSPAEQRQVNADRRRAGGSAALRAISEAAASGRPVVTGGDESAG